MGGVRLTHLHQRGVRQIRGGGGQLTDPAAALATLLKAATDVSSGSASWVAGTDITSQPDFGRTLVFTFVDADTSITDGSITVQGYDAWGVQITEVISGIDTSVSLTYETNQPFAFVSQIDVSLTGAAAGDTLAAGTTTKLGIPKALRPGQTSQLVAVLIGSTDDLDAGGTVNATYSTYDPNTAPNGATTYTFIVAER